MLKIVLIFSSLVVLNIWSQIPDPNTVVKGVGNPPVPPCESGCSDPVIAQRNTRMMSSYSTLDPSSCGQFIGSAPTSESAEYSVDAFSITKTYNSGNLLKFAVRVNAQCEIIGGPTPYWILGEESRASGNKIKCVGLASGDETSFFAPTSRSASTNRVSFALGVLTSPKVTKVTDPVTFGSKVTIKSAINSSGVCNITTSGTVSRDGTSQTLAVTRLHTVISFMSISSIELNGTDVSTLLR